MTAAGPQARRAGWLRTAAWYRAPGVAALAAGLGLAFGRPDVALLAAPLAVGWVAALLATRHLLGGPAPRATSSLAAGSAGRSTVDVVTTVAATGRVELVSVVQPGECSGPVGRIVTVAGQRPQRLLGGRFHADRWGSVAVARPDSLGAGPDGVAIAGPVRYGPIRTELILPAVTVIPPLALPPILGGWAGAHLSRRPGQGSDLVDLREFAPGDRLRSIHWRAYARHERLYTRRTLSDADAEWMICVDLSAFAAPRRPGAATGRGTRLVRQLDAVRVALGDALHARSDPHRRQRRAEHESRLRASSLDHAVAAATAVAAAQLGQGDRVGMMTPTVPRTLLRPGAGNRQLLRIRQRLALLLERRQRLLPVQWWGLRPGQIVVWCSPLTTPASIAAATDCAARGHRVVVVDTLPLAGLLARASASDADHLRVLVVERELELDRLRAHGIGVLCWDAGDVAAQVAEAARSMRGRR